MEDLLQKLENTTLCLQSTDDGFEQKDFCAHSHKSEEQYKRCLKRIAKHRDKLYQDFLDNFIKFMNIGMFCNQGFYADLECAIRSAKSSLTEWKLSSNQKLQILNETNNSTLVGKYFFLKKDYLILSVLKDAFKHLLLVENLYSTTSREYKKKVDGVVENVTALHDNYKSFIIMFNIILTLNENNENVFSKFCFELIQKWNMKLLLMIKELFIWTFSFIQWPIITKELKDPSPVHLKVFELTLKFLLDLESGDFGIEKNVLTKLRLFNNSDNEFNDSIKLLAEPFEKRFRFHFINPSSKLNNLDNVRVVEYFILF